MRLYALVLMADFLELSAATHIRPGNGGNEPAIVTCNFFCGYICMFTYQ